MKLWTRRIRPPVPPDDNSTRLKAVGTFSYNRCLPRGAFYEHFITTLMIVVQAAEWLERFPTLRKMISDRLQGKTRPDEVNTSELPLN